MKAIVLAGGKGTRLQSVLPDLPKPLAPVQGEPFLFFLLRFLRHHGIEEIIVSVHHMSEKFAALLPALKKLSPEIKLLKEPEPLGTGGAVRFACSGMPPENAVLVLNGDTFFDFDLRGFLLRHKGQAALALKEVPDASRYGTVEIDNGNIRRFLEKTPKPAAGLIYAGFALLRVGDLRRLLPEGASSLEKDFFPRFLEDGGQLFGAAYPGPFIDIGIPEDYREANSRFDFSRGRAND